MFCENCGKKLSDSAKFCGSCGTAVHVNKEEINEEDSNKRKIVYEGDVHKCPNCGEVLKAFEVKCSSCGFELNNKKVSKSLSDFIEKVNFCEQQISNSSVAYKSGWATWSGGKKAWFIIGNIFLAFIPLIIYFMIPLIKINSDPSLSAEEKQLESLIENFPFPNERESIIDALLFTKEKMEFISKKELNRKNSYWFKLWDSKAVQLKQKSDLLFPNDNMVQQIYSEIVQKENMVNTKLKIKLGIGIGLFVAMILIYLSRMY